MAVLDREQFEAFKREIEEDYRLDLAAIERLQWRCISMNGGLPHKTDSEPLPNIAQRPLPTVPQAQQQPDGMTNSLAEMFMSYRK